MSLKTVEARLNIFIRLIGVFLIFIGGILAYYTATTPLVSQIVPVFYFLAFLLVFIGFVAVIAKLK